MSKKSGEVRVNFTSGRNSTPRLSISGDIGLDSIIETLNTQFEKVIFPSKMKNGKIYRNNAPYYSLEYLKNTIQIKPLYSETTNTARSELSSAAEELKTNFSGQGYTIV